MRRIDLDWLRVLAVLLLVPFHSALIFVQNPNSIMYVKDVVNVAALDATAGWVHQFHMPLLFWISGAAAFFGLSRRGAGQFAQERVSRLIYPALFGIVFLLPLMTYITQRWLGHKITFWQHLAGFWTFGPDLSGVSGTWTPAHLWFLLFLFFFSIVGLPVFLLLRSHAADGALNALAKFFALPGTVFLLALPMALAAAVDLLGDKNPIYYFIVFLTGYVMMTRPAYQVAIRRALPAALVLGVIFTLIRQLWHPGFAEWSAPWIGYGLMVELNRWVWVLAWLGLGERFLNKSGPALAYLSETSFAFYVLHLPINTLVAWGIIQLDITAGIKYLLIVAATTALTFGAVELFRHIPLVNRIFSLKKKPGAPQIAQVQA